jgi:hypothetical protein
MVTFKRAVKKRAENAEHLVSGMTEPVAQAVHIEIRSFSQMRSLGGDKAWP